MRNKKRLVKFILFCFIINIFGSFKYTSLFVAATTMSFSVTSEVSNELSNQNWTINKIITVSGVDYYTIANNNTDKVLSISNNIVTQSNYLVGNAYQLWEIILQDSSNNYYSIRNKSNGKYLSLGSGDDTTSGQEVILYNTTGPGFTLFQFNWVKIASGGKYSILSVWPIYKLQGNGSKTIYVSNSEGNDDNDGLTDLSPVKTLDKISSTTFGEGDRILLKSGDTWAGESLILNGSGTPEAPIILTSYGEGAKPRISPGVMDANCIYGSGVDGWKISNLDLSNAKDGIHLDYNQTYDHDFFWIENCYIHDLDNTYNSLPERYNHISSGISINGFSPDEDRTILSNLTVDGIDFNNVNCAWWVGAPFANCNNQTGFSTSSYFTYIANSNLRNMHVDNGGQWGYSFCFMRSATITNCDTFGTGSISNPYGSAGIVVANSNDVVLDGCDIFNARRNSNQNYDGVGFDFEGGFNQYNITYKNAIIQNTDGAGIMLYDNGRGEGFGTANAIVENVKINYFGENPGNSSGGIVFFQNAGSGEVKNCVMNKSIDNVNYIDGDSSRFTMTDICLASNLTPGKTSISSGNSSGYDASKAFDGDITTYWCTDGSIFPSYLQVDLGSLQRITNINQLFNNDDLWKFIIQTSNNGITWTTLIDNSLTGAYGSKFTYDCNTFARYARLFVIESNIHWATSKEFAVYGVPATSTQIGLGDFILAGSIISNIQPDSNLTLNKFMDNVLFGNAAAYSFLKDGNTINSNDIVGTGTKLEVLNNDTLISLDLVIFGDVDGNGDITIADLVNIKNHILKTTMLNGIYQNAGDTNRDFAITISDLISIKKHILGTLTINQKQTF